MRNLLVFAALLLVGGVYIARSADKFVLASHPQAAAAAPAAAPREPASSGRSLMVERERDGHFRIESRINGRFVPVMVDTGASRVILRETDAANVGIRPRPSDYTAAVSTANGKVNAAPAMLDRVEAGGITVYDVPALVLPDNVLATNLLGMSFLSRLKRYEVANERLVLEQKAQPQAPLIPAEVGIQLDLLGTSALGPAFAGTNGDRLQNGRDRFARPRRWAMSAPPRRFEDVHVSQA